MINNQPCIICGETKMKVAFNNGIFRVIECIHCGFGIIDPVPDDATLNGLYNSAIYFNTHMHFDYDHLSSSELKDLVNRQGAFHFAHLKNYWTSGKSLLEIGCGYGLQLVYFRDKGLQVKGVERSENAAAFCRDKLHLDVINTALENYNDKEKYDIVMLNHALEHFTDLHLAMNKIYSLIRPGGFLYIRVPNHDSFDRRKLGAAWPAYLPFHISYFSEKSLRILLKKYNIHVMVVKEYVSDECFKWLPHKPRHYAKLALSIIGLTKKFNGRTITMIGKYDP